MQVTAASPIREHERPMSWARAMVIAVGFFFLTAILVGQLPSYIFTISTASTLTHFEQGTLDLGLLALGFGLIALEVSFLYDPKPLIPWILFAVVGAGIAIVGAFLLFQVWQGVWPQQIPTEQQKYLLNPGWFQVGSIDISAVGMIALLTGLGMFSTAALTRPVLSGSILGPTRDLFVRFGLGLALVLLALYTTVLTFAPAAVGGADHPAGIGNVILFLAVISAIFALQVWLLPVMVANRQRFMPGVYLHGVVGLLGSVAIPMLVIWAAVFPVVNLIHKVDAEQFWVECAQKTNIPGSCTFSPFTGYIICAIVFSMTFGLLIAGLYFWSTRRDTVILGGAIGMLYLALAASVIHLDVPAQVPLGLIIAASIAVAAFVFTWATQREFAPVSPQQLGCTGQWLVLGTLLLIYLFGFALFSMPNFFEIEALALFYQPGQGGLHDAFWAFLLMGGLAALQFTIFVRRRPMSALRKFALWAMLAGVVFELIGAIQGFTRDILVSGLTAMEGAHAIFITGVGFTLAGFLAALYGAVRARGAISVWPLIILVPALASLAVGIVIYNLIIYPELIVFAFVLALAGAFAYSAAGPDLEDELALAAGTGNGANGHGQGAEPFVVSR
jgi:hypothetical protein